VSPVRIVSPHRTLCGVTIMNCQVGTLDQMGSSIRRNICLESGREHESGFSSIAYHAILGDALARHAKRLAAMVLPRWAGRLDCFGGLMNEYSDTMVRSVHAASSRRAMIIGPVTRWTDLGYGFVRPDANPDGYDVFCQILERATRLTELRSGAS
jgi:hypothetical protein